MSRARVLFLTHLLPYPLDGGGQIKSFHTLKALASRYDVTLLALIRRSEEAEKVGPLPELCGGGIKLIVLTRGSLTNVSNALRSLLQGNSFLMTRDADKAMQQALNNELSARQYDAVHVDHLQMAAFIPDAPLSCVKIVLDQHNIEHRIPKRLAEAPGLNPLARWYAAQEWPKVRTFEAKACRRADLVLTVSDEDANGLVELAPEIAGKTKAVPIGVDTDYFAVAKRTPEANDLLSIGTMYWPPNVDAMTYFVAEILPLIRAKRPATRLVICGARPTPAITALGQADSQIVVTGTVPDVRPSADTCGVFIVPLRSGSGMRVKILNALSMGLPVVSTSVGAEGIDVTHGKDILLADTPQAFAEAVLQILSDPELAKRLSQNGRALMENKYSWQAVTNQLLHVYDDLLTRGVA